MASLPLHRSHRGGVWRVIEATWFGSGDEAGWPPAGWGGHEGVTQGRRDKAMGLVLPSLPGQGHVGRSGLSKAIALSPGAPSPLHGDPGGLLSPLT